MAANILESLLPKNHSFHLEYIEDFKALSQETQNQLLFETYQNFLTCFRCFSYETWINMFYNPELVSIKLLLLKDEYFNRYAGSVLIEVYSLKYIENDPSIENEYITSKLCIQVLEQYHGLGLGEKMIIESERLVQKAFPGKNRMSLNLVLNPISLHVGFKMTSLTYPSLNPYPDEEVKNFLKKCRDMLHLQSPNEEKPYHVYYEGACAVGLPKKEFFANLEKLSLHKQTFIKQTGLEVGHIFITLSFFNLLENNTLKLPAGNYERFESTGIELKEFTSL